MKPIVIGLILGCSLSAILAGDVRLVELEPDQAAQYINSADQSLGYAPKIQSNVPALRYIGNHQQHVSEDIYLANQYHGQDGLGAYVYGYRVPDIAKTEKKERSGDLRGAYNYIAGNGQEIKVQYWDDGTGFHQIDNVPREPPEDNPEVKAAKEEHLRIWQEQAIRNSQAPDPNEQFRQQQEQAQNQYHAQSYGGNYQGFSGYPAAGGPSKPSGLYQQSHGSPLSPNSVEYSGQYSSNVQSSLPGPAGAGQHSSGVGIGGPHGAGVGGSHGAGVGGQHGVGDGVGGSGSGQHGIGGVGGVGGAIGGAGHQGAGVGGQHAVSGGYGVGGVGAGLGTGAGSQHGAGIGIGGGSGGPHGAGIGIGGGSGGPHGAGIGIGGGSGGPHGAGIGIGGGSGGPQGAGIGIGGGVGGQHGAGVGVVGGSEHGAGSGSGAIGIAGHPGGAGVVGISGQHGGPGGVGVGASVSGQHGSGSGFGVGFGSGGSGAVAGAGAAGAGHHDDEEQAWASQGSSGSASYQSSQKTWAGQGSGAGVGAWAGKQGQDEEESGPPKGFFYSFDYPVGVIVGKEGQQNLEGAYSQNKEFFEKKLQESAAQTNPAKQYLPAP